MSAITAFSGKQNNRDKEILAALLSSGPLTTSQITKQIGYSNKHNLQAKLKTLLKLLERQDFIYFEKRKWLLRGKGIIAVLLAEPNVEAWSPIWSEIFQKTIVIINASTTLFDIKQEDTEKTVHDLGLCLNELNTWKGFAKITKRFIDAGTVSFDEVADSTLLNLLLMETLSLEDVAGLFQFGRL
jgi:hypothetical protein